MTIEVPGVGIYTVSTFEIELPLDRIVKELAGEIVEKLPRLKCRDPTLSRVD